MMTAPDRIWLGIASDTLDVREWSHDKPAEWPGVLYLRATPELIRLIDAAGRAGRKMPPDWETDNGLLGATYAFARSSEHTHQPSGGAQPTEPSPCPPSSSPPR